MYDSIANYIRVYSLTSGDDEEPEELLVSELEEDDEDVIDVEEEIEDTLDLDLQTRYKVYHVNLTHLRC